MKVVSITACPTRNLTPIVKVSALFPHVVISGYNAMNNPACSLPSSNTHVRLTASYAKNLAF
ncbi:hypothetical protein MA16_Dca025355 [Dendrobium catenatum]|uniref:Uncharacterized protein n=1 Tax=Dendrobium catenatum TaxID=906689 RepID=A0A2I0VUW2_9ASPA|nr:hypothetical protein MA16_Dca025355 [Dendrobium catenatum]